MPYLTPENDSSPNRRKEFAGRAIFVLGVALFALLAFRTLLTPGAILFSTDDNIGAIVQRKNALPEAFWRGWNDQTFIGQWEPAMPSWTNLVIWALPARLAHNLLHALDLGLASVFFMLFLRRRGVGWVGVAAGALTAFWVGSNFTLVYAGHIGKFGVLLFAALFLWLAERAATERRAAASASLAGGALGAMFLEQADIALFFALALGPYALLRIGRVWGASRREWARRLVPLLAVALLIAFHPLWAGYAAHVRDAAPLTAEADERWAFVTQWSWPPEECIDFIAPGFTGWRTGEPAGPYWGRLGRGGPLSNFKLENQYLGALPLALAAVAVAIALGKRAAGGAAHERQVETRFWFGVALAALALSFGKFTPLYSLVMRLPVISAVRAPVKWLQPFQLAIGILAAFGVDELRKREGWRSPGARRFSACALSAAALLALVAGALALGRAETVRRLAAEWGEAAPTIARNRIAALAHGAAMCGAAALLPALLARRSPARRFAPAVVVAAVGADALWLSRHYVERLPRNWIAENPLTRSLKAEIGEDRVALLSQQSFYGAWLTYLFPYHGIRALNFTQMPRMSATVRIFLERVMPFPPRYWQLAGAPLILLPPEAWTAIRQDPDWRESFAPRLIYRPQLAEDGGIAFVPARAEDRDAHALVRARSGFGRYEWRRRWRAADDAATLNALADFERDPTTEALIAPEFGALPPAPENETPASASIRVISSRPGVYRLRVATPTPALLRIADRYDPRWRADLDGRALSVARVDYLFMGVFVPAGEHELTVEFRPSRASFLPLALGVALCLAAAARRLVRRGAAEDFD